MTTRPSFIAITSPLVLAAMLLLPSSMASAALTGACLKDAKALCAGVQPGGGKIRACLKTHLKDLSDDCQAVVLKAVNAKACAADVKHFAQTPRLARAALRLASKVTSPILAMPAK